MGLNHMNPAEPVAIQISESFSFIYITVVKFFRQVIQASNTDVFADKLMNTLSVWNNGVTAAIWLEDYYFSSFYLL